MEQLMISKQTLIGGTAAALLLVCGISTASAAPRHGMSGSVGGNQSVRANVGANGASGTAQLSEGTRTTGQVRSSATMNGSRDLANSTRFNRSADIRGEREFATYGNRNYNAGSARVERGSDVYAGQYARNAYVGGYDRAWRYGGVSYATVGSGFGYGPDYAYVGYGGPYYDYVGYGGPYYDYAPGYASAGYYDYAPGFSVGVGFAPAYGGCTCAR